eukprot:scaffold155660_cov58-Attheya_sp.AAC.7
MCDDSQTGGVGIAQDGVSNVLEVDFQHGRDELIAKGLVHVMVELECSHQLCMFVEVLGGCHMAWDDHGLSARDVNAAVGGLFKFGCQGGDHRTDEMHRDFVGGCHGEWVTFEHSHSITARSLQRPPKIREIGQDGDSEPHRWRAGANTSDLSSSIDEHNTAVKKAAIGKQ